MSKGNEGMTVKEVKKFDKKKWREKKYSHKYKVQQWENKRNNAVIKQYYKDLNKDERNRLALDHNDTKSLSQQFPSFSQPKRKKINCYKAAQLELKRLKEEKRIAKLGERKRLEEMKEALDGYKKKRTDRFKLLSRKTASGQPSMSGRMLMLYEQIQKSLS